MDYYKLKLKLSYPPETGM